MELQTSKSYPEQHYSFPKLFPMAISKKEPIKSLFHQTASCTRGNSPVNTTIFNLWDPSNLLDFDHFRKWGKKQHFPALAIIDLKQGKRQKQVQGFLSDLKRKPCGHILCCFSLGPSKQDRCSQYPGSSWSLSTSKALWGGGWKGKEGEEKEEAIWL